SDLTAWAADIGQAVRTDEDRRARTRTDEDGRGIHSENEQVSRNPAMRRRPSLPFSPGRFHDGLRERSFHAIFPSIGFRVKSISDRPTEPDVEPEAELDTDYFEEAGNPPEKFTRSVTGDVLDRVPHISVRQFPCGVGLGHDADQFLLLHHGEATQL